MFPRRVFSNNATVRAQCLVNNQLGDFLFAILSSLHSVLSGEFGFYVVCRVYTDSKQTKNIVVVL